MPDILHLVKIQASPERVYQAITTAEGIRHWWTRDAVLDSKVGGTGEFGFQDNRTITRVRIDEIEPPVRVAWTTISSNAPGGWGGHNDHVRSAAGGERHGGLIRASWLRGG